jgi:hypothetical protein
MIEQTLTAIYYLVAKDTECEALLCIDKLHGQYVLMSDGWVNGQRYYHTIIVHIELRPTAEVWLRCDNTDLQIGQQLIGIAKDEILPSFYSPAMRKFAKVA